MTGTELIRRVDRDEQLEACLSIANELPEYFNGPGFLQMAADLRSHAVYVYGDRAVDGFIAVNKMSDVVFEISWMAVRKEMQRQGVGSRLLDRVADDLRYAGVALLKVKTLAATVDYKPYDATRNFYRRMGFHEVEVVDPYPVWGPGNPCSIMVRPLRMPTSP